MNHNKNQFYRVFATIIMLIILAPGIGYSLSDEDIFIWVADQMRIQDTYALPSVMFVDKEGIQKAFIEGNRNGYMRWETQYGKEKAKEILQDYLDEIVGLFNDKTRSIYVGSFLSSCRQQAVLAHEFVHYYQYVIEGSIIPGTFQEGIRRFAREMKAYSIENKFKETFCSQDDSLNIADATP